MSRLGIYLLGTRRTQTLSYLFSAARKGELGDVHILGLGSDRRRGVLRAFAGEPVPRVRIDTADWDAFGRHLDELAPDVVLLLGFLRIVPAGLCRRFLFLNLHPGDPVTYPGKDPQARALNAGERHAVNTIHVATEDLDRGPILVQQYVKIEADDTEESLSERMERLSLPLWRLVIEQRYWQFVC